MLSRQSRKAMRKSNASLCSKDDGGAVVACAGRRGDASRSSSSASTATGEDIVIEKRHLVNLALNTTSCAGCIASIRTLLNRPLSELRMLKAIVDEEGASCLRLKNGYLNDSKRTAQLLDTFPMSSVLKKVQPVGNSQRCQLHRRAFSAVGASSTIGWNRGADAGGSGGGGVGGGGRGSGVADSWDWEDAWERMPHNLRVEVASVKACTLEAAMHHATESARFCADCRHNVVQAHDILMGKMDLEGSENEEEFDEELFQPFGDRLMCRGENGSEKMLFLDVMDVEDLIYWHEGFVSQDFDSHSSGGQQRHAATLDQGQREVRSILGAVLLSQLRSVWHRHTAQVQAENYLFCLVVDAVRTQLAARCAAPHDHHEMLMMMMLEKGDVRRCSSSADAAGEGRRQKRRQKRKEKKLQQRAGKNGTASTTSISSPRPTSNFNPNSKFNSTSNSSSHSECAHAGAATRVSKSSVEGVRRRGRGAGMTVEKQVVSGLGAGSDSSTRARATPLSSGLGKQVEVEVEVGGAVVASSRDRITTGRSSSGLVTKEEAIHGGFGAGGLAFQLSGGGDADDFSDDDDVDHDLLTEMEQLKARARSRSDIDCLRKTLRQNYDRFISRGAGSVLH